ncbi:MAG: LPS-assembly protein LptD, partial [Rhodobacteraceae bacterium]|nr:LPS-assembly protein LptD [Paracoccaceae bacterium]
MPHHPLTLRPTPATAPVSRAPTRRLGRKATLIAAQMMLATAIPTGALIGGAALVRAETAPTAQLLADKLSVTNDTRLVAEGHVEVTYDGNRLTATRVTYDRASDRMVIDGPLVLTNPDGSQQLMASQADLAANMTQGLLTAVRMVVDQRLTMTADQALRTSGGVTELTRVVASTCKVCAGQTPIWEIRARSLRHDETAKRVTFDHAVLRLAGLPIFFLPRLTLPDPSVSRATGVLIPSVTVSTTLGTVARVPVFLTLGPSRDITLTPALGSHTNTMGFRYREAFDTGRIEITGAASQDDQRSFVRGYTKANGNFDLPQDFKLTFKLQAVSDAGYFLDYGLPEVDRLDSRVAVDRTRRMEYVGARLVTFNSLRDGDDGAIQPSVVADATYDRRFALPMGQQANLRLDAHSQYRTSSDSLTDSNGDGIIDGRDQSHLTLTGDWQATGI